VASSAPYFLDPFTEITSVNFGSGVWVVALVDLAPQVVGGFINGQGPPAYPDVAGSVEMDISTIAGGTPGFTLIQDITPISGSKPSPYTIQRADLTRPQRADAGAGLIGFSVNLVTTQKATSAPFTTFHSTGVALFLLCSGLLSKTFTLRMTGKTTNNNSQGLMEVGIYKSGLIKAGVVVDFKNNLPAVTAGAEAPFGKPNDTDTHVADFVVNPKDLTVSGP
jgi:hypothetical protein